MWISIQYYHYLVIEFWSLSLNTRQTIFVDRIKPIFMCILIGQPCRLSTFYIHAFPSFDEIINEIFFLRIDLYYLFCLQAYYGPRVTLPPYYNSAMASGHAPHPYIWGPPQVLFIAGNQLKISIFSDFSLQSYIS